MGQSRPGQTWRSDARAVRNLSTDSIPQIRGGQVRALAVSSATRLPALPDVPTVAEYLPDYAFDSWVGIARPKNIPC